MKDDLFETGQKELPGSGVVKKALVNLYFLEDWLKIWARKHPLPFKERATICCYEATDLLRNAFYIWQGRKKFNHDVIKQQVGDLIIMGMTLAVEQNVNLKECLQLAIERIENLEYKKSGAKTA